MIRPVRPIGPTMLAFGANAPIANPTNRTAPTPSENPPRLIWPTRYPTPIARNTARIGWLPRMSRARSNIKRLLLAIGGELVIRSACVAAGSTELVDHTLGEIRRRRRRVDELVFEVHRLPLERAHLMERLHLDPLDVLHRGDEVGDAIDIRRIVGLARNECESDPDRFRHRGQPLGEAKRRRDVAPGHPLIGPRIRAFDVEKH